MSGLRNRGASGSGGSSLSQTFASYDAYAKPLEDFRVKTIVGASLTLVSVAVIALLLMSEFSDWIRIEMVPSLEVDKSRLELMKINMDITFPKIPCFLLGIDVMDVAGEHQNGADHLMHKTRLDTSGVAIAEKEQLQKLGTSEMDEGRNKTMAKDYCGSCYGSKPDPKSCCNTCDDVRVAYRIAGWSLENPDQFEQCVHEGFSKLIASQAHEGCNLEGYIQVSKVMGNFHFAPGASFEIQGMHAHDLNDYRSHKYDWTFTHSIRHLSFGQPVIGLSNPLDGHSKIAKGSYDTYQYYIKVVSTLVTYLNSSTLLTNQFASTEHERDVTPSFGAMPTSMPGVFFNYEISPMLIKYQEFRKPFSHFLTDVCAIVGGVFTVAGLIDGLLYSTARSFAKKAEIGKAS